MEDPKDQELVTVMAHRIVRLQGLIEGLLEVLMSKGMITQAEVTTAVQRLRLRQKENLRRSQKSPGELAEEFLLGFEGPEQ